MSELPNRQPNVTKEFCDGNFVVRKTGRVFSSIAIDQAHKQNNVLIKQMEELLASQIIQDPMLQLQRCLE